MDPKLVPFGGEAGSGDSLVLDVKTGRVLYWDHEEGEADASDPVAKSLEELLATLRRALERRRVAARGSPCARSFDSHGHLHLELQVGSGEGCDADSRDARPCSIEEWEKLLHDDLLGLRPEVGHVGTEDDDVLWLGAERVERRPKVLEHDRGLFGERAGDGTASTPPRDLSRYPGESTRLDDGYLRIADASGIRERIRIVS